MLSNACLCSPSRNAEPLPSTEEKVFGNSNYLPTPVPLQLNFKTLFIWTIYMFFATAKWGLVLVTQGTVRSGSASFQEVALYPTGTTHGAQRLYEMACDTTSYSKLGTGLWNQGEIQICIIQTHLERWREIKFSQLARSTCCQSWRTVSNHFFQPICYFNLCNYFQGLWLLL